MVGYILKFGDVNYGNYLEVFGVLIWLIGRNGLGDVVKGLNNQGGNFRGGVFVGCGDLLGQEKDVLVDFWMRWGGLGLSEGLGNFCSVGGFGLYEKEVFLRW